MRKLTALCLGLCLLFSLAACGQPPKQFPNPLTPEEVAEEFIQQLQGLHYDHEALRFVFDYSPENQLDFRLQHALVGAMTCTVNGTNNAPDVPNIAEEGEEELPKIGVSVTVTAPKADVILDDFTRQLNQELKQHPDADLLAPDAQELLDSMLLRSLEQYPETTTQDMDLLLEQQETGQWVILFPEQLLDALLGGLFTAYSQR